MALFLVHKEESFQWGVWKMDETADELLGLLPRRDYYEEETHRFKAAHRKLEWLSVRALLYRLLGRHVEVCYEPSGKPYLADQSLYISISHTKGYVAVVLSTVASVGIDIEQYGQKVHKVAHKYVREDEKIIPYNKEETWCLLLHWSAKEVMFKCMDTADVDFRKHLHIEPFALQECGSMVAHEYRTERKRTFRIDYLIHPDFVLTWYVDSI